MRTSKLGKIIAQLSTVERTIIDGSLTTPLIGGRDYHLVLYRYCENLVTSNKELDRSEISRNLYKNTATDAHIRLHMSELYRLISSTLVMIHSRDDSYYQDRTLIDRYKNLEDPKLYDSQLSVGKKRLEAHPHRNAMYHELAFELGYLDVTHISNSNRTQDLNLQNLLDEIDYIHISKKLRQACFSLAHESVYGQKYDYGLLEQILQHIESENLLHIPAIKLYHSAYQMLSTPTEATYFDAFKNDIDTLKHLFPDDELQGIYRFAINQCIRLINRGQIQYGSISLDLYEEALSNGYLLVEGHLSRFTYRNIAAVAVKIGEYDRAEAFTTNNRDALKKEERHSAYHFNWALISYHRADYDTALSSLQLVDFKDHLFNLAAKVIQIKVYYESDDIDLLESHLDAMQMYLLRKKVIGYHKTNYKNIIKLTRKLLKANKSDRIAVTHLKEEISQTEILTEKKWLLSQL